MRAGLLTAWMASIGLIAYKSVTANRRPPLPSEMLATVVVFGTLSLIGGEAAGPADLFAWGLVVAGALNIIPGVANLDTPGSQHLSVKEASAVKPAIQSAGANIGAAGRIAP